MGISSVLLLGLKKSLKRSERGTILEKKSSAAEANVSVTVTNPSSLPSYRTLGNFLTVLFETMATTMTRLMLAVLL